MTKKKTATIEELVRTFRYGDVSEISDEGFDRLTAYNMLLREEKLIKELTGFWTLVVCPLFLWWVLGLKVAVGFIVIFMALGLCLHEDKT